MSHSKKTKRGNSLYVESWNPSAKNFINTCRVCGKQGYSPSIDEEGFIHPSPTVTNHIHSVIHAELTTIYHPLPLDDLGRCECCARLMDSKTIR